MNAVIIIPMIAPRSGLSALAPNLWLFMMLVFVLISFPICFSDWFHKRKNWIWWLLVAYGILAVISVPIANKIAGMII